MKRQTNENGNKPVQNRGDIEGKVVPTNVRLNCKTTFPVETPPLKEQYNKEFRKFLFKKEQKNGWGMLSIAHSERMPRNRRLGSRWTRRKKL